MRHPTTGDKIVVSLDRDEHWTYFSVRDDRDNGTIIDFLQHRGRRSLADVRREVRVWSGEYRSAVPPEYVPVRAAQAGAVHVLREMFARAHLRASSPYLNSRGIQPDTLRCDGFAGTWRVDDRGDLALSTLRPARRWARPLRIRAQERRGSPASPPVGQRLSGPATRKSTIQARLHGSSYRRTQLSPVSIRSRWRGTPARVAASANARPGTSRARSLR